MNIDFSIDEAKLLLNVFLQTRVEFPLKDVLEGKQKLSQKIVDIVNKLEIVINNQERNNMQEVQNPEVQPASEPEVQPVAEPSVEAAG